MKPRGGLEAVRGCRIVTDLSLHSAERVEHLGHAGLVVKVLVELQRLLESGKGDQKGSSESLCAPRLLRTVARP